MAKIILALIGVLACEVLCQYVYGLYDAPDSFVTLMDRAFDMLMRWEF